MWGRITRILLGFGLLCIIFAFTVPRFSTPSHTFSASSPPSPRGDRFCKFRQRVNVALSDRTGSARGIICTDSAVEAFLGIPYAKPPVGPLRFNAPTNLEAKSSRVFEGSKFGKTCLQQTSEAQRKRMSEDCLTINVFRPGGTSSRAKLPVMVWVYGGALMAGDSVSYNPTGILLESAKKTFPVIYVSFNYRLNSFGFTASSIIEEAAASGKASLNAGLYDMQSALLWVQRNIGAFGGDKNKVTVFGQSAGAIGIGALLLADEGRAVSKLNLFRAAILQSGGPVGSPARFANETDAMFSKFTAAAGCSSSPAPLECLRAQPEEVIRQATDSVCSESPYTLCYVPAQDGYFHSITSSESVRCGQVAAVPMIIGNSLDEGTVFAPTNVIDIPGIAGVFKGHVRGQHLDSFLPSLRNALLFYPDDPKQGSPYEPRGSLRHQFYGRNNQYKRLASLLGDAIVESGRRMLLQEYTRRDASYPAYTYLFATHRPGEHPSLGVPHGADLDFVYGEYGASDPTSELGKISIMMMNAWINFAYFLDPNGDGVPPWPKYGRDRRMLRIDSKFPIITDKYREKPMEFLASSNWTSLLDL